MPQQILENKNLILFLNLKFNVMKRRGLIFNSQPNKAVIVADVDAVSGFPDMGLCKC